jgi:hypothetical protein
MANGRSRLELHDLVYGVLLEKVRQDRYPSTTMLDILEHNMMGHEREELVDLLLEKVLADRYISIPMLNRLVRVVG